MVAILHNIRSLFNTGSIFRTADAAGVEKIYLCGITPSPLDDFGKPRPQLAKVSLGAENYVPWEKVANTAKAITQLKKEGYVIAAVELAKNSVSYFEAARKLKNKKVALIVGHEVKGLPKSVLKKADIIIEIPMCGKKESLNVGVAFGIVAYALTEKR